VPPLVPATVKRSASRIALAVVAATLLAAPAAAVRPAAFTAHGSVQQLYVTGARPGQRLLLLDRRGRLVRSQRAGSLGGIVYRDVPVGGGYRVATANRELVSAPVTVVPDRSAPPSTSIYNQPIPASGYGYLTVRDGIKLAIDV
jgi:hypothetical protein